MIIVPVIFVTVMLNAASLIGLNVLGQSVLLPSLVMVGFAILGAVDDWEGIRGPRRGSGMRIRTKFLLQTILALGAALSLRYLLNVPQFHWPSAQHPLELGIWYVPVAMFIIVAMSNAVNFTDGMDGLAGLISATCFAAYGVIHYRLVRSISPVSASPWLERSLASCGSMSTLPSSSWEIQDLLRSGLLWLM